MFVIIGYLVVIAAVFGGYGLAGGKFGVLAVAAPVEMLIIGGAALGAFLVGNNAKVIKATFATIPKLFKGSKYTKARYMSLLALLYDILQKARKEGLMSIEQDVDEPHESAVFANYPEIVADHHLVEFITDYLRMMVSGNLNAHEIESLMDSEIETHHQEEHAPAGAIQKVGDGLPAFGIVAAVLGVVKTMASVDQPPAVLGGMIAGALVGTFLGILLAYGFVSPLAGLLEQKGDEATKELVCVKTTLLASMQGYAPAIAVEFGRKVLFSTERPTFAELEDTVKQKRA
jgi:chemotaxis protein MotA